MKALSGDRGDPGAVVAICGSSGSGKTSLLEALIPHFIGAGLSIAAVRHDTQELESERLGRDSDRLLQAGASVALQASREIRASCRESQPGSLLDLLRRLEVRHDLVLVEGGGSTPLPRIRLLGPDEQQAAKAPPDPPDLAVLAPGADRIGRSLELIEALLERHWSSRPLHGAVLIGGRSRRMGRPKQLIRIGRATMVERVAAALEAHVDRLVVIGTGQLPASLAGCSRLADVPGVHGPLGGVLAASRCVPEATWLIAACDQPFITEAAVTWLLAQRRPGRWAIQPRLIGAFAGHGSRSTASTGPSSPWSSRLKVEPLLAIYEPQAGHLLEALAGEPSTGPAALAGRDRIAHPSPPPELELAWTSIDDASTLSRWMAEQQHGRADEPGEPRHG